MARLVDYFTANCGTTSCHELTERFSVSGFATADRIERCMNIIALVTSATARLLSNEDDTFEDLEKEKYFIEREGPVSTGTTEGCSGKA